MDAALERVKIKLQDRRDSLIEFVAFGKVQNFEHYKFISGQITAFGEALDSIAVANREMNEEE